MGENILTTTKSRIDTIDVLRGFALTGLFRHLPPKLLLVLSLMLIINLPTHLHELFQPVQSEAQVDFPMEEEAKSYYSLVKNGDFTKVLQENWHSWAVKN